MGIYSCGICGQAFKTINAPKCDMCQKILCPACYSGGLCPTHFKILKPEDQTNLVQKTGSWNLLQKLILFSSFIDLIVIFGILPYLKYNNPDLGKIMIFFIIFSILFIPYMFIVYRGKIVQLERNQILKQYEFIRKNDPNHPHQICESCHKFQYDTVCPICSSRICNVCSKGGFCPTDFNKFTSEEQEKLLHLDKKNGPIPFGFLLKIIWIFPFIFLLIYVFLFQNDSPLITSNILVFLFVILGAAVAVYLQSFAFFSFRNRLTEKYKKKSIT